MFGTVYPVEEAMRKAPLVGLCALCLGLLIGPAAARARSVSIMPKTTHSALTLNTDGSYGYQVVPGKPLQLDLVGPGTLVFTVRLNHTQKLPSIAGEVTIRRAGKPIKVDSLNLFRSRVGAYKEDRRLAPSIAKSFKMRVPDGVQSYSLSLRAGKGVSMTVGIDYDSEADQSAAIPMDEMALVPLVPPGGSGPAEPAGLDDLPLVPLVPPVAEPTRPAEARPPVVAAVEPVKPVEPRPPVKLPEVKPAEDKPPLVAAAEPSKPTEPERRAVRVETIEGQVTQPPEVEGQAPAGEPVVSIGVKLGQITPLQSVGNTAFTGSLDLRWIIPALEGNLSLGVEVGYHQYAVAVSGQDLETSLKVIPISLQLYYGLPLGSIVRLFFGAGGDLFVVLSETRYQSATSASVSGTSAAFGGHVALGVEFELGPGFLGLEARAGFSAADLPAISNVNVAGVATTLGYRLVF